MRVRLSETSLSTRTTSHEAERVRAIAALLEGRAKADEHRWQGADFVDLDVEGVLPGVCLASKAQGADAAAMCAGWEAHAASG